MNREKFRINFALVLLLLLISAVSGWYNNWSGKLADKKICGGSGCGDSPAGHLGCYRQWKTGYTDAFRQYDALYTLR